MSIFKAPFKVSAENKLTITKSLGGYQPVVDAVSSSITHDTGLDGILYRNERLANSITNPDGFLTEKNNELKALGEKIKKTYIETFRELYATGMNSVEARVLATKKVNALQEAEMEIINAKFPQNFVGSALGMEISQSNSKKNLQIASLIDNAPSTRTRIKGKGKSKGKK
jgi:hypothetical protein